MPSTCATKPSMSHITPILAALLRRTNGLCGRSCRQVTIEARMQDPVERLGGLKAIGDSRFQGTFEPRDKFRDVFMRRVGFK
jgi:hypothetical protein